MSFEGRVAIGFAQLFMLFNILVKNTTLDDEERDEKIKVKKE